MRMSTRTTKTTTTTTPVTTTTKRQEKIMSAQYRYRKCGGYRFARVGNFFFPFVCHFFRAPVPPGFSFSTSATTVSRTQYALVDIICFWCTYFTLYCAFWWKFVEWRERSVMHEKCWMCWTNRKRRKQFGRAAHSTQNEITDDDDFWGRATQANEVQMIFSFFLVFSIWHA